MSWPPKDVILRPGEAAPKDVRLRPYPGVATLPAYGISDIKATLAGQIEALTPFDTRGFDWGTASGVYTASWTEGGTFGTGLYSHDILGLSQCQRIYFRAKVHGASGWLYGSELSFSAVRIPVEFRLTEVEPPAEDPPRTIYTDILNLPDPVYLGLTVRVYNFDDVGLYMRMDGYGAGWTFNTVNLGLLASGNNFYATMDNFAHKAKPGAAEEDTVVVRLRAYTDAAYTNLRTTYEKVVDIIFIQSNDGSWTQNVLNNFDDGTVQGWDRVQVSGPPPTSEYFNVAADYILSAPYSLKYDLFRAGGDSWEAYLYKSFVTPNVGNVFAIINIRGDPTDNPPGSGLFASLSVTRFGGGVETTLLYLGDPTAWGAKVPRQRWLRLVVKLPSNTALELRIRIRQSSGWSDLCVWMDDFTIISK